MSKNTELHLRKLRLRSSTLRGWFWKTPNIPTVSRVSFISGSLGLEEFLQLGTLEEALKSELLEVLNGAK